VLEFPGSPVHFDDRFPVTEFIYYPAGMTPQLNSWGIDSNGNWTAARTWTRGVPNKAGAHAVLGSTITSPRTVTVNAPITVGRLDFDSTKAYTIAGSIPAILTLDATSGDAQINVVSGSHTISAPLRLLDNATITVTPAGSNLSLTGPFVGQKVTKAGAGMLTMNYVRATSLAVNGGTVTIAPVGTPAVTSTVGALSIAGDATPTAKLDLAKSAAIINYTGSSPAATVRQQILAGRGGAGLGKGWDGMGITSSAAATVNAAEPESRSVGYAENSAMPLGPLTTFRGQPVDDTSILMAYTRTGDANLDGVVNDDDVTIVGAAYAPGVAQPSWALGDFDYSGFVDDDDVTLLGAFYDPSAPPLNPPAEPGASGVAAVPEPGTLVIAASAVLFLVAVVQLRRSGARQ
jgi:hypothetical protein